MSEHEDRLGGDASLRIARIGHERLAVGLTNYGARMLSIEAPDRQGAMDHVLLGFDQPEMILKSGSFGCVLGRYANRIAKGRFTLDGEAYQLSQNDGANTLHGGKAALGKQVWTLVARDDLSATFTIESPDGDQGFPGALSARALYRVEGQTLRLELFARVTKPCPVNLSAHPYFNLGGAAALDCYDHDLQVGASHYLPTDAAQIPTGERAPVAGSPFDFREPTRIGARIRSPDPQMLVARGYDHCFVIDGAAGALRRAARVTHGPSGRALEVWTDRPGCQVYTGNSLNGSLVGWGGAYRQGAGLALEAQAFPDAPNQPGFPSTVLRPGEEFRARIDYRFGLA